MGKIKQSYLLSNRFCLITVEGELKTEDILEWIVMPLQYSPVDMVLWDFSDGALSFDLNKESQGPINSETVWKNSSGNKTALVCPKELDFGLYRILKLFNLVQDYPTGLRIFRKMKKASQWLGLCHLCCSVSSGDSASFIPCRTNCSRFEHNPPS